MLGVTVVTWGLHISKTIVQIDAADRSNWLSVDGDIFQTEFDNKQFDKPRRRHLVSFRLVQMLRRLRENVNSTGIVAANTYVSFEFGLDKVLKTNFLLLIWGCLLTFRQNEDLRQTKENINVSYRDILFTR